MALKIYTDTLELVRGMRGTLTEIARKDADLARQMRRALTSVALNTAEGEHRRDGNARTRFTCAMGSANEVRASLEVAEALGYIAEHAAERDIETRHDLTRRPKRAQPPLPPVAIDLPVALGDVQRNALHRTTKLIRKTTVPSLDHRDDRNQLATDRE